MSGIIFISLNDSRWCDALKKCGSAKTLYNSWNHWSDHGVFARIVPGLAAARAEDKTIMMDAT